MTVIATPAPYPVQFDAEYPARQSRWKTLLRLPLVLPALIFAALASYLAFLALPVMWLAILVRGRIPRWLFDFEVGVNRFNARVQAYFSLLTDVYPAFDGAYPVRYDVVYPERVSRWKLVIWKFATSVPQWIVVWVLQYAAFAVVAIGWLVILFSGQFPQGLHGFVVGVMRWRERVYAYSLSLTDEYPPYSTSADAPATRGGAYAASAGVGVLVIGGLVAGLVALIVTAPFAGEEKVIEVSYNRILEGEVTPGEVMVNVNNVTVELISALDPADDAFSFYAPRPGYRLVAFSLLVTNTRDYSFDVPYRSIDGGNFELNSGMDAWSDPLVAVIDRRAPPVLLDPAYTAPADLVFEVPTGNRPVELSFDRGGFLSDTAIFRFR